MRREALFHVKCEWICRRCGNLHRTRFKVIAGKKNGDIAQDCIIEDYPLGNSTIHAKWDMELNKVFSALKDHMECFYSVGPESLSMDILRE
jgi:hypothetical protein